MKRGFGADFLAHAADTAWNARTDTTGITDTTDTDAPSTTGTSAQRCAIARCSAQLWHAGSWQSLHEAISPETTVSIRYADGACRLQAWSGNPDHPDWQRDLEDLCLGHVLLDKQHVGPEDGPSPVRRSGRACAACAAEGTWSVEVELDTPSVSSAPRVPDVPPSGRVLPAAASVSGQSEGQSAGQSESGGDPGTLTPDALLRHMETFLTLPGTCPGIWESTGCFHRAALLDTRTGVFVHLAEDIGRHNCLDRLAGWVCRTGQRTEDFVLFLSARITGSLYAKARRAGFRFFVSRAAVTTMPLDACLRARSTTGETGEQVTLVGFCRPREARFTVFYDPEGRVLPC